MNQQSLFLRLLLLLGILSGSAQCFLTSPNASGRLTTVMEPSIRPLQVSLLDQEDITNNDNKEKAPQWQQRQKQNLPEEKKKEEVDAATVFVVAMVFQTVFVWTAVIYTGGVFIPYALYHSGVLNSGMLYY